MDLCLTESADNSSVFSCSDKGRQDVRRTIRLFRDGGCLNCLTISFPPVIEAFSEWGLVWKDEQEQRHEHEAKEQESSSSCSAPLKQPESIRFFFLFGRCIDPKGKKKAGEGNFSGRNEMGITDADSDLDPDLSRLFLWADCPLPPFWESPDHPAESWWKDRKAGCADCFRF